MGSTDLSSKVIDLRARGLTPKQIAKTLGVRRADVEPLVRAYAQSVSPAAELRLVGCWVSPAWSSGLRWEGHREWRDELADDEDDGDVLPQIASVLVARENRYGKVSACGYLVDSHCLGVKDAIGPRSMDRAELREFVRQFFRGYDEEPQAAPLELVQDLVLGAVDYARRLGFEPHPDFEACRGHLGSWVGPSAVEFGYRGEPYFIEGPHDDADRILRTLERSVGRGNFKFVILGHVS